MFSYLPLRDHKCLPGASQCLGTGMVCDGLRTRLGFVTLHWRWTRELTYLQQSDSLPDLDTVWIYGGVETPL